MLRPANGNDIDNIIDIHLATLGNGLLAKLGRGFLKKIFYPFCLQSEDVLILVYEKENIITSFALYTKNSPLLTNQLLNKKFALATAIIKNIFLKPSILIDIMIVMKGFRVHDAYGKIEILERNYAELYLIATKPEFQGCRIGSILVSEGLKEFYKEKNVSTCIVKTSSSRAQQFYLANQFVLIGVEYRGRQCFHILCKQ